LFQKSIVRGSVGARREEELDRLVAEIKAAGGEAVALAVRQHGRLDIAFNNAGTIGEAGPSTRVWEAGWNDALATDLTSAFLSAKHQIAEMQKHGGGSVIFTSTFVGYSYAFPGVAAYAASKSGLIGLTQALAAEFGASNIRVNAGTARLHHQPARAETRRDAGRARALAALPRLRRCELRDRHRDAGRWGDVDYKELRRGARTRQRVRRVGPAGPMLPMSECIV